MKILFVTTCYPEEGNSQYCIFLEQQAKALFGFSNSVDVLYANTSATEKKEYEYNGIKVFEFPLKRLSKLDLVFPTRLPDHDIDYLKSVLSNNYDIVSLHFMENNLKRSMMKVCRTLNIPVIFHFHGLNVWYEEKEKYKLLYDWFRVQNKGIYKKADAVVGVSDKVCAEFSKKIKNVPAYPVYNGVNVDMFSYRNKAALRSPLKILCVANLIDLKGQDLLLKAVAEVVKGGVDCRLTIVGKGPNEQDLKRLSSDLGISDKVSFKGVMPYGSLPTVMDENDLFIMPSYYEALGCVYLEAMASGMITVGVEGQGIDGVIKDSENGFLVKPKSVDSIVSVVNRIKELGNDELSRISDAARKTAGEYTWYNSAKALNEVYEKTVSVYREGKN